MADREKIVRHIKAEIEIAKLCKKDFASVDIDMLSDAYALLKEQEPIWNDVLNVWTCPSCGQMVSTNYCRDCGRKVKWEK